VPNESVAPSQQPIPTQPVAPAGRVATPLDGPRSEYEHVLSYFKYLVTLSTAFLSLIIGLGAYLFHSNMKEVREDAMQEATRVATAEAKAGVAKAFDEKNIDAMILSAAQQKVGTITDKLIEQQLTSKLRPIQQRISLIGQISECEMRMRMGFRLGLDELNRIIKDSTDPDVARFGKITLATTSQDFQTRLEEDMKQAAQKGIPRLQLFMLKQGRPQQSVASNLHDVVQLIERCYEEFQEHCVERHDLRETDTNALMYLNFKEGTLTLWKGE